MEGQVFDFVFVASVVLRQKHLKWAEGEDNLFLSHYFISATYRVTYDSMVFEGKVVLKFLSSFGSLININTEVLYYEKELQSRVGRYIVGNKLGKKNTKDKKLTWIKMHPGWG